MSTAYKNAQLQVPGGNRTGAAAGQQACDPPVVRVTSTINYFIQGLSDLFYVYFELKLWLMC